VLITATGLFSAIVLAIRNATSARQLRSIVCGDAVYLPKTSLRPPWTISLTKPMSFASCTENFRPVRASSLALESLPMTFGKRCSVPISAARPTLTSYLISLGSKVPPWTYGDRKNGVTGCESDVTCRSDIDS